MANAFTNLGATPFKMPTVGSGNSFVSSYNQTAQNKALNNVQATPTLSLDPKAPPPSSAVKSTKITDASGNTHETTYHAPAPTTGLLSGNKSASLSDVSAALNKAGVTNTMPVQQTTQNQNTQTPPPPQNVPAPTDYSATNPATYPGMINTTANVSGNAANTGATNYNTANQDLMAATAANQKYADRAQEIANTAGQTMSDIGRTGAMGEAGYRTTGTSPVGEGNAAVLAQTTAAQQQAVAQGANMQLAGNAQGLTAQNQMQSGYNQAGTMGLTGQGQGLTGLNNAASLAQPQVGQYGQTYYNPLTAGTSGGTGGVSPTDPFYQTLQSYAQMAAKGQLSQVPSSITSNAVLNDQLNQMAKTINPAYNPVTSSAQGTITAGQQQNVATMTASYKSATNLGSQLNDLITTFGINPSDINAVNSGISKIAQNVSSPKYKALNNLVTDIVATYSSILTPGSTTDTARATAASLLDASAKGSSIMDTLSYLDEQAKAKIAGQTTGYGENPSVGTGGGNFNEGQTTSSGGYNFIYQNGKWVAK